MKLKDGMTLVPEGADISQHGKTILGDDLPEAEGESERCSDTRDLFECLSGPMGRVIK